jgi:hypothetical protein
MRSHEPLFGFTLNSRIRARFWVTAALTSALLLVGMVLNGTAAASYFFNPTLSLTGDCSTSSFDPVADPGCSPPEGERPQSGFTRPGGVAVDAYGNRYVASHGTLEGEGGRIDVFSSTGHFITEITDTSGPTTMAVNADGVLYVNEYSYFQSPDPEVPRISRFVPTTYDPQSGIVIYGKPRETVYNSGDLPGKLTGSCGGLAINGSNDHLFYNASGSDIYEFGSAAEGTPVLDVNIGADPETGASLVYGGCALTVDSAHDRIYAAGYPNQSLTAQVVRVFALGGSHELLNTYNGSNTPTKKFVSAHSLGLAVDEASGHLFASDLEAPKKRIYELDGVGGLVDTIEEKLLAVDYTGSIAVDNGAPSPTQGYLFAPGGAGPGHSIAFEPKQVPKPPLVESARPTGITESDTVLRGAINPQGQDTTYRIEYTTQQGFQEEGFAGAVLAREGVLKAASEGIAISAGVTGLTPRTAYRFRVTAHSSDGDDEKQASFTTFGPPDLSSECANDALRSGASAALPDCRAYELVTPGDTNGRSPQGQGLAGILFATRETSPAGDAVSFKVDGGLLPGFEGTGSFTGETYLARRGTDGWGTEATGPNGSEAKAMLAGSHSPDQGYFIWEASGAGSAVLAPEGTDYVRYPDGHSELIGEGSLATEYRVAPRMLGENGEHLIFLAPTKQLEPNAPPDGTAAIYDRAPDGTLRVVSLLPGEATSAARATYLGASLDGAGVAFALSESDAMYLRRDDRETFDGVPQARSGRQLTCTNNGSLAGGALSYEWLLDGAPIPGATASTYTPQSSQAGSLIQCVALAANAEGGAIDASPPLLLDKAHPGGAPPRPPARGLPRLPSAATVGQTLQCQTGPWGAAPSFSYQWYRNGTPISGASSSTYQTQAADNHTQLQCEVAGQANGTTAIAFTVLVEVNPPTPPFKLESPAISNLTHPKAAPIAGDQLSCSEGEWGNGPTISYQWLRSGAPIAGEAAATHTVVAADEGVALQCEVSAVNAFGTARAASAAVGVVPLLATELPSGEVVFEGRFAIGSMLKCEPRIWKNSPTFSYQWLRNGAPIAGATEDSYQLSAADREKVIQCALTATGAKGVVLALGGRYVNEKPKPHLPVQGQRTTFEGISEGGSRLFYLLDGDLFAFDSTSGETIPFSESGDATVVNISADGSAAYFLSPTVQASTNPNGAVAQPGGQNLYLSREGQVSFLGTVTELDVKGKSGVNVPVGLGRWDIALQNGGSSLASVPARSSANGSALLFESRAKLTEYDSEGHGEVYRYDAAAETLSCLSCSPTQAPPSGDGRLQATLQSFADPEPLTNNDLTENLTADGKRAFFESDDPLVLADTDGLADVYEWEEEGVGSCHTQEGCVYLISSGHSVHPNYIYAVSAGGRDVFIRSADLLVPARDAASTPSIYDARVEGGFPDPAGANGECLGEACQPAAVPPNDPTPASSSFEGSGNVAQEAKGKKKARCPKGKRALHSRGKTRCAPVHKKHKANAKQGRAHR